MNTIQSANNNHVRILWLAVALALIAALAYILMAQNLLGVGDLQKDDAPPGIVYIAAGGYLLGGPLILIRRRWLWVIGAVINALVMLLFFSMYQDRPAVMFSPGGITTKVPQLLLEATLIYLIVANWIHPRRPGLAKN
jgi:hypothetical protein